MTSKPYTKDDLKKLMRERASKLNETKKIDSALALYDEEGNLHCKICNIKIKNETYWSDHLIDRIHKNNLEKLKKNKKSTTASVEHDINKKRKTNFESNEDKKVKFQKIFTAEDAVKLSEEKGEIKLNEEKIENSLESINIDNEEMVVDSNQELPIGFFDNPKDNAKVRNEIYQDPLDEEWKNFQKTIKEENESFANQTDSDHFETQNYRNIIELDEQIEYWKKINELEIKRENKKQTIKTDIIDNKLDSDFSEEDLDLEEEMCLFSNWRSKKEKLKNN